MRPGHFVVVCMAMGMAALLIAGCATGGAVGPEASTVPEEATEPGAGTLPEEATGPEPGAVLEGTIAIQGKDSSGSLTLTVSEDGSEITDTIVTVRPLDCGGMQAESWKTEFNAGAPIREGAFEIASSNLGEIRGQFSSPTHAEGTIRISFKIEVLSQTYNCELGTGSWEAEAR